jgi:hypothetical protein
MKHISNYNEFENELNEKLGLKGALAAGLIFLASCTHVSIENKNGQEIDNSEYANKKIEGVITHKGTLDIGGKPHFKCDVKDQNGNTIEVDIDASYFDDEKNPQKGDKVILQFDENGEKCEINKNSKESPNIYKRI